MKKKSNGTIWMILGLLLIAAALCVILHNYLDNRRAQSTADDAESAVVQIIEENIEESLARDRDAAEKGDTAEILPLYKRYPDLEMPLAYLENGFAYIGILEIPALNVTLPIMDELTDETMKVGPGRWYGSAYRDDIIIAAHNYDSHFGRLDQLKVGDEIIFTDIGGNRFTYEAIGFETMHRSQAQQMMLGDWDMTLFTCVPMTYNRLAVRCVRTSE